jgi:hypothetical protein
MQGDDREEFEAERANPDDLRNDEWLKDNFYELINQYPREWIAVMDRKVICHAATRDDAEVDAREIAGDRPFSLYFIPPTGTVTDVMYSTPQP